MHSKTLFTLLLVLTGWNLQAQPLFTYGKYTATVPEFLRAFEKNNAVTAGTNKANAKKEYLDLYINSRLKIRQAYDRGYDSLPGLQNELASLRSQVIDNYLTDQKVIDKLTSEAFSRSQKDIHAAHIFIAFNTVNGNLDTVQAYKKLQTVLGQLKAGQDFGTVAATYSDDPSAKNNKGDLGFITVFTLPYNLETLIYTTPVGRYSAVYTSTAGYHIVKNIGERKALGKIKAQQILLAFPPDATAADKAAIAKTADSLYNAIRKGSDFVQLIGTFSNDYISASAGGTMPDISVGHYSPAFENVLFSLKKDGEVSKPFLTEHGWHIVKRVGAKPVPVTNTAAYQEELKQKVLYDDRWKTSRNHIYTAVEQKGNYVKANYNTTALWDYSDSALYLKPAGVSNWDIHSSTVLFSINGKAFTAQDWINYAQAYRNQASQGAAAYTALLQDYTRQSMYNYYREHLEDFNPDFKAQMEEFTEGNLFFEIMQQEVWNKSQNDTTKLLELYNSNPAKYNWGKSADAVVFFCNDVTTAKALYAQIKANPAKWRTYVNAVNEKVVADSARYELDQIPRFKTGVKEKSLSHLSTNSQENSTTFCYVFKVYNTPTPRSFNEARGLVISDYQNQLEAEWLKELKEIYPVKVNEAEWNKIK